MTKRVYKTTDLFGNEQVMFVENIKKRVSLFDNHEAFIEKFEAKKTTDDCHTPQEVYSTVVDYVAQKIDLTGLQIIRPFYPNGDFELIEYPENCIVIDNPPFSIISRITRFYLERQIKFFLFAPHLTLFGSDQDCTAVVVGASVIYENGANVKTSFLTNIFEDVKILGEPELLNSLEAINNAKKANLPKYEYPENVLTVSMVYKWVLRGIPFEAKKADCQFCRGLDDQRKHDKSIFGSGFLISDKAAADKAAADKAKTEGFDTVILWQLSEKEKQIIKNLGK